MERKIQALIAGSIASLALACSHAQPAARVDDGSLVRLNEQQMQPVDAARIEEGRARDQVARAHALTQDARSKVDIAKAERDVAQAQQSRSKAELELLQHQKADLADLERARTDAQTAADRVQATDLKIDYLNRQVELAGMEEQIAAQHAEVAQAMTERAKFQALEANAPNEVRGINPAHIDSRLADSQAKEANLRKQTADKRAELVEVYNRWQALDAKVRTAPAPAPMQPAQPTLPPPSPTQQEQTPPQRALPPPPPTPQ
jgi:hypothetical protein